MDEKKRDGAEVPACHHMQRHVHALADNTLKGPLHWYTRLHCSYCGRCGSALQTYRDARESHPVAEVHPTRPV